LELGTQEIGAKGASAFAVISTISTVLHFSLWNLILHALPQYLHRFLRFSTHADEEHDRQLPINEQKCLLSWDANMAQKIHILN